MYYLCYTYIFLLVTHCSFEYEECVFLKHLLEYFDLEIVLITFYGRIFLFIQTDLFFIIER